MRKHTIRGYLKRLLVKIRASSRDLVFRGLLVLSLAILAVAFGSQTRSEQQKKVLEQQTKQNAPENGDGKSFWERFTYLEERTLDDPVAFFTFVLSVSTIGLWVVTWTGMRTQAGDMQKSLIVSKDASRAARDANILTRKLFMMENRAWLSIENVELINPTQFGDDQFVLRVCVTIKNVGATPALSIQLQIEPCYFRGGEAFREAESRVTNAARNRPSMIGTTIFPNDILKICEIQSSAADVFAPCITTRNDGTRMAHLTFFINVSYAVVGDAERHMTHRIYDWLNIPFGTAIGAGSSVTLQPILFLPGETD